MQDTVRSLNGAPIRLTGERWAHIMLRHPECGGLQQEVMNTVAIPQRILRGDAFKLWAVREIEPGKRLVVVYREGIPDASVITAFLTRRINSLNRRQQLWPQ